MRLLSPFSYFLREGVGDGLIGKPGKGLGMG